MNTYFFKMTNEERNNILDQHKEIYDGYVTSYAQPEKNQPLYTQDYANDKEGVTVNNQGDVSSYKTMKINEMHADGKSTGLFSDEETEQFIPYGGANAPEESFESEEEDEGHYVSLGEQLDMIGDGDDDLDHGTFEDDNEGDEFNRLSHKGKINYLVNNFGMDKREAFELCPDSSITFDDLPNEIKGHDDELFDDDDDIMALTNPDDSDDDFDLNIMDLFGLEDEVDEFEQGEQDDIISNITESLDMFKRFMKYN